MAERKIMSGNEAVARGAWEGGLHFAAAYPGTPSTEILENMAQYKEIHSQWSTNEKVSLEVAGGAVFAGARALVAMKHVGLNVAADPLFSFAYIGARGALVIVSADDPSMHSSQNEQDNRNFAKHARIPLIEPSDSQEAKDFTKAALDISHEFDTPVLLRLTTRISHSYSIVELGERKEIPLIGYEKDIKKNVIIPAHAKRLHKIVEERMQRLAEFSETFFGNRIEEGNNKKGFITSGISYQYVKEIFPEYSVLKLSMTYPLPEKLIRKFADMVDELYVIEEVDPFLEEQIKAMGIKVKGKEIIPRIWELNPRIVAESFGLAEEGLKVDIPDLPPRPPALCPGCPHTGLFYTLNKLKVTVTGDIGCYTLGALEPLNAMDTCVCMGASIGNSLGLELAVRKEDPQFARKIVAVIGDSTFYHSGITGLIDVVYNKGTSVTVILDNSITAMTGHQDNPGTGKTLMGEPAPVINLTNIVKAVGIKEENVREVDGYDLAEIEKVMKEELAKEEPSVVIVRRPCVLIPEIRKQPKKPYYVIPDKCIGCKICLRTGCSALSYDKETNKVSINPLLCTGCSVCAQTCPVDAIVQEENDGE